MAKKPDIDTNKLEQVTDGMVFKNYREMCSFLGLEEKGGVAKSTQMEGLKQYFFEYEQQGHKIVVKEVYKTPVLEPLTNRKNKYADDLTNNILVYLKRMVENPNSHRGNITTLCTESGEILYDVYITRNRLMLEMGMFNEKYPKKQIGKDLAFAFPTEKGEQFSIREFYKMTNSKLTSILVSSLNALKRKFLLEWDSVFFKGYLNGMCNTLASPEEQKYIMSVLHNELLQFGVNTEYDIIISDKTDEFYEKVNSIIKEELGCDYIYKSIHIKYFTPENIQYEISDRINKNQFNEKVVEGLRETIDNKMEKNNRLALQKEIDINMNSFIYPSYFKASQEALVDYLVKIEDEPRYYIPNYSKDSTLEEDEIDYREYEKDWTKHHNLKYNIR